MQAAPGLDDDVKDEVAAAVMQQTVALKQMKDEASGIAVAEAPSPQTRKTIDATLQNTCTVLDRVKDVCDRTLRHRRKGRALRGQGAADRALGATSVRSAVNESDGRSPPGETCTGAAAG